MKLTAIQRAMVSLTNSELWEEVEQRFPNHTLRRVLFQFIQLKLTNKIPSELHKFCETLMKIEAKGEASLLVVANWFPS